MFVKVLIVIFAFLTSYLFYYQVLKPEVFDPTCITNTNNCINIEYYKYKNTVYGNVLPSGYSFWFNGDKIFVYGINNSKQCENQEVYEPAYAIDPDNGNPLYYECIERAGNVKDKYIKEYNIKPNYIYKKNDGYFGIYDVMNLLRKKNIVKF